MINTRIAVIGGRDFNDYSALALALVEFKPKMIISGNVLAGMNRNTKIEVYIVKVL